jgi:TolB-like protein
MRRENHHRGSHLPAKFTRALFGMVSFSFSRRHKTFAIDLSKNSMGFTRILTVIFLLHLTCACSTIPQRLAHTGIPRSERAGVAILNFKNTSAQERATQFQPWEYGIATMLTTDLETIGIFNIVERERLKDIMQEHKLQSSDLVDRNTAVAIGKLTAARYILTGSFAEMQGELRIGVQIFSVEKGMQLGAASIIGETNKFFLIEKKLFVKVIDFLEVMLSEEEKAKILKNIETESVDASLKNYSGEVAMAKAEELKKMGENEESIRLLREAKQRFTEALEYDPNYARAKKNLATLARAIPITL